MAREKRDNSAVVPRNDAQDKYIRAIAHKQLIIANGGPDAAKPLSVPALAADALINKIRRIIVTVRCYQAEGSGLSAGDISEKNSRRISRPVYDVLVKRMGLHFTVLSASGDR